MAKAAVAAAKNGSVVVRLVAGDPYTADAVVKEVLAVGRTSCPSTSCPASPPPPPSPAYAGVAVGSTAVTGPTCAAGWTCPRWPARPPRRGTLVLQGGAEVPDAAARLVEGGLSDTPVVVTTGGSGTAQKSVPTKLRRRREDRRLGDRHRWSSPSAAAVDKRARLSWWESRPLFGWRVLVPRTKDQAGEMSERLRAYGAVPVEVPTIAVEPPRSPAQMDRAIKGLVTGRYGWIVFTSVNAVKAVREKFAELGLDARAFAGVKVACVGEQTADAVRAFGIVPELVPSGRAVQRGPAGRLPAVRRRLRPDRPRAAAARRHRDRDAGRRAEGARLGDRRRDRLPDRAGRAAGGLGPRGDQGRRLRRRLLHLVVAPCATWSASPASRTRDRRRRHRPATAASAREFGLRVDVQPETAAVGAGRRARRVRDRPCGRGAREGRGGGRPQGGPPALTSRRPAITDRATSGLTPGEVARSVYWRQPAVSDIGIPLAHLR